MYLSVVIPVYNEVENLRPLWQELTQACATLNRPYELLFVDDGSQDGSVALLEQLHHSDPEHVVLLQFRRNFGQTAAFAAGFAHAQGQLVVTLDADRQNDPADIPHLIHTLEQSGVDVVNGWRQQRQDGWLLRRLPSGLANQFIATMTGLKLHDRGCSLRLMRQEVVQSLRLYGEMHRFIPELIHNAGFTMSERPVNHRPRTAGQSKYGLSRTLRVVLDLATILFLHRYADRPMHLFGSLGLLTGLTGFVTAFYLALQKLTAGWQGGWPAFHAYEIGNRPLLLIAILLMIVGVQFLVSGLIAELLVRTYYESQNKPVYYLKKILRHPAKN